MKQTHIKKKKKEYEINSLIYKLSFLVIYPSNCYFYKRQPNTQLFQKAHFNSFYQILSFLKMHFFIMYFLKLNFFIMYFYEKLNQTHKPLFGVILVYYSNLTTSLVFTRNPSLCRSELSLHFLLNNDIFIYFGIILDLTMKIKFLLANFTLFQFIFVIKYT